MDDASRSPGPVAAVAAAHGARLLPLLANVGPAGARNAGLRLVTTPYAVFVDSDVVLPPDTVPPCCGTSPTPASPSSRPASPAW
ncbi:glycosyltransferase family 2 protein [Streptomyces sp. INA 01156]